MVSYVSCCTNPYALLALVSILCMVASSVYMRYTYLFEYTALADTIRPLNRRVCELTTYRGSVNVNESDKSHDNPLKIGIIYMYESTDNSTKAWSDTLLAPLIENRQSYCKQHGYTLIDVNPLLDWSRPASWSKLLAMEHHFKHNHYDYLLYMDMDIIIMNPHIKLETFIEASRRNFDIILTEDSNGINAGVFLARNSPWTMWFLRTAWEQTQLVPHNAPNGQPYPFRWEQRAFHYMTNSAVWRATGLPTYPGYEAVRSHMFILPQCAFNSYILHPLDFYVDRESSQYAPGDFLIHFAGKAGESKKKLMEYYLDELRSNSGGGSGGGGGGGRGDRPTLRLRTNSSSGGS